MVWGASAASGVASASSSFFSAASFLGDALEAAAPGVFLNPVAVLPAAVVAVLAPAALTPAAPGLDDVAVVPGVLLAAEAGAPTSLLAATGALVPATLGAAAPGLEATPGLEAALVVEDLAAELAEELEDPGRAPGVGLLVAPGVGLAPEAGLAVAVLLAAEGPVLEAAVPVAVDLAAVVPLDSGFLAAAVEEGPLDLLAAAPGLAAAAPVVLVVVVVLEALVVVLLVVLAPATPVLGAAVLVLVDAAVEAPGAVLLAPADAGVGLGAGLTPTPTTLGLGALEGRDAPVEPAGLGAVLAPAPARGFLAAAAVPGVVLEAVAAPTLDVAAVGFGPAEVLDAVGLVEAAVAREDAAPTPGRADAAVFGLAEGGVGAAVRLGEGFPAAADLKAGPALAGDFVVGGPVLVLAGSALESDATTAAVAAAATAAVPAAAATAAVTATSLSSTASSFFSSASSLGDSVSSTSVVVAAGAGEASLSCSWEVFKLRSDLGVAGIRLMSGTPNWSGVLGGASAEEGSASSVFCSSSVLMIIGAWTSTGAGEGDCSFGTRSSIRSLTTS